MLPVFHYQGLQRLLPSLSELDQSHPEHDRGCRREGNTTGRSNLLPASHWPFRGFQLLLLWLMWVTLLCSKARHPLNQAAAMPSASFPPPLDCAGPKRCVLQRSWKRAHQLAEFMLPGLDYMTQWGECSEEETGSVTMCYTWREKRRLNSFWFWTQKRKKKKAYPKFPFPLQYVDTPIGSS